MVVALIRGLAITTVGSGRGVAHARYAYIACGAGNAVRLSVTCTTLLG
jgi:hypothetical protein